MTDRGLARFTTPRSGSGPSAAAPAPANDAAALPDADEIPPALARFLTARKPPTPGEACELCVAPVPEDHRHVVDLERRSLLCSCRGCALLFEFSGSSHGRYRTVPERYLRIEPFTLPPQAWATLQIPVGMAFVVNNTQLERSVAFYPSPGGATESELPLDAWSQIVAANPGLDQAEPDVEAVLIRTGGDGEQCFVVPVDRCYELVGVLRMHWRGFDGGQEVREHIAEFFADVTRRGRPVRVTSSDAGDHR
ncbi:DUF5947 family protein [soil metagenome]